MSWGAKTDATQLTNVTTEQYFQFGGSYKVSLNPGETASVRVQYTPAASPTDSLVVSVYASVDDGASYDVSPILSFSIDRTPSPNSTTFLVSGIPAFRVGVKRSGSTDTIPTANCSYRKDGINL